MLFTVTADTTNNEGSFTTHQSIRAARKWAKWMRGQKWASNVTIWRGQPGGERIDNEAG